MSEKNDITDRLQKLGSTISEYTDNLKAHFKDMEVEMRDWNFAVGKTEKEYSVEVKLKLVIKPKE